MLSAAIRTKGHHHADDDAALGWLPGAAFGLVTTAVLVLAGAAIDALVRRGARQVVTNGPTPPLLTDSELSMY